MSCERHIYDARTWMFSLPDTSGGFAVAPSRSRSAFGPVPAGACKTDTPHVTTSGKRSARPLDASHSLECFCSKTRQTLNRQMTVAQYTLAGPAVLSPSTCTRRRFGSLGRC